MNSSNTSLSLSLSLSLTHTLFYESDTLFLLHTHSMTSLKALHNSHAHALYRSLLELLRESSTPLNEELTRDLQVLTVN